MIPINRTTIVVVFKIDLTLALPAKWTDNQLHFMLDEVVCEIGEVATDLGVDLTFGSEVIGGLYLDHQENVRVRVKAGSHGHTALRTTTRDKARFILGCAVEHQVRLGRIGDRYMTLAYALQKQEDS